MSDNKLNKKIIIPYCFALLFSLAAYLIYTLVPVSDIANSVEHSGMDAVYILTASPVCAFIALISLCLALIFNFKQLGNNKSSKLILSLSAILPVAFSVASAVFCTMFTVSQYQLGFTSPIDDTQWYTYSKFILVNFIVELLVAIVTIVISKIKKK